MLNKLTQLNKWRHLADLADQQGQGDPKVTMVKKSVIKVK